MNHVTKEYVFQFQRFDFEILDGEKLLSSAREVLANEPPRVGHAYPHNLESKVDAIDVHLAAWGVGGLKCARVRCKAHRGAVNHTDRIDAITEVARTFTYDLSFATRLTPLAASTSCEIPPVPQDLP